jgi:hypothetical protein
MLLGKGSYLYKFYVILILAFIAVMNQNCSSGFEVMPGNAENNAGADSCELPWGGRLLPGEFASAFETGSVPVGQSCRSEIIECVNGQLTGTYRFQNCAVAPAQSCTLPWGGVINNGQSARAFASTSVPQGQTCQEQQRQCNNGTLSGSYTYQACTVAGGPSTTDGIKINLNHVNLTSAKYTRFKNYVDAAVNGANPYGFAAMDAAYMFKLTNQQQYCTLSIRLTDNQVIAAETAMSSGQRPAVASDSYLEVGPFLSDLAITYDWCSAYVTANQRSRWTAYANQAIYNVWNPNSASWGGTPHTWTGWSIDNPGNNYFYSFTEATMFWGLASDNQAMISLARDKMNMLHAYFSALPGGGSLEGTGYGQAHMRLFGLYAVWKDSTGEDYANSNSHLTDSIKYWVHATTPNRSQYAAIGDQSRVSNPEIFDYFRRLLLAARMGTTSTSAKDLASWSLNHISVQQMGQGFNYRHDLMDPGTNTSNAPNESLVYQANGVGQVFARTGWDTNALWMQFTAGTYNESHAHRDQGSFTLASNSWLAVTANVWSHSGINQGSDVHNMVRFVRNGSTILQRSPSTSTIVINSQNSSGAVNATANLTPAFRNDPNIQSWTRNIDFAGRRLLVTDNYAVTSGTEAIFQVNVPTLPTISGNVITAGALRIRVVTPSSPTISIHTWNTVSDFNSGYRIDIRGASGQFVVELTN